MNVFRIGSLIIVLYSMTLSGCLLGPNFHSPRAPCIDCYTPKPMARKTIAVPKAGKAGVAQTFVYGEDLPAAWWEVFHSKEINELVRLGLLHSPNIAAAKATLVQTQYLFSVQMSNALFPNIGLQTYAERERFTNAIFGGSVNASKGSNVFNLYNANVMISYTLDIFGGLRRQIEASHAQVEYQQFELEGAFLTLTSNIVTTAFTIASFKAQIQATHELIDLQQQQLDIIRSQFTLGGVSRLSVLSQEATLEQTKATLPPLQQSLATNLHALSVLIGEYPCENQLPHFSFNQLDLPTNLPVSCPSLLVRQRPDIRAAESLLHAASAQIGVATANMYPQFTITGSYGYESPVFPKLFSPNSKLWDFIAQLTQPIFNGGALVSQRQANIAAYKNAGAVYAQTVLQAFQNVADTLRALQHDAKTLKAQKAAEIAAKNSFNLVRQQYRVGGVNYLNLIVAEQQYQQAIINRIKAQASRFTDTAALFQALGGGWWHRPSLECNVFVNKNVSRYAPGCI